MYSFFTTHLLLHDTAPARTHLRTENTPMTMLTNDQLAIDAFGHCLQLIAGGLGLMHLGTRAAACAKHKGQAGLA